MTNICTVDCFLLPGLLKSQTLWEFETTSGFTEMKELRSHTWIWLSVGVEHISDIYSSQSLEEALLLLSLTHFVRFQWNGLYPDLNTSSRSLHRAWIISVFLILHSSIWIQEGTLSASSVNGSSCDMCRSGNCFKKLLTPALLSFYRGLHWSSFVCLTLTMTSWNWVCLLKGSISEWFWRNDTVLGGRRCDNTS